VVALGVQCRHGGGRVTKMPSMSVNHRPEPPNVGQGVVRAHITSRVHVQRVSISTCPGQGAGVAECPP